MKVVLGESQPRNLTMENLCRAGHICLHVVPKERVIFWTGTKVEFDRVAPRNQLPTKVDVAASFGKVHGWVETHYPACKKAKLVKTCQDYKCWFVRLIKIKPTKNF